MRTKRTRVWIDRFQTHLFLRIAAYFVLYQLAVWTFVYMAQSSFPGLQAVVGPSAAAYCIACAVGLVAWLGLLFIYDAIKFAHRIVGPLYRFRKVVQAITAGEPISLVALRKGDYLHDLKDDFNAMLKALEERGAIVLRSPEASPKQEPARV